MKLKNKKTGEMATLTLSSNGEELLLIRNSEMITHNVKLSDLEEWEGYEEPKEYYCIDWTEPNGIYRTNYVDTRDDFNKEIGNCFESLEDAERAVEKLKAWKRLKDNGFRFIDHIDRDIGQGMTRYEWNGYIDGEDLDLLFGGEE